MEFDLGDAIPKLQLLRDKQKTFAIECFEQVIDRGSVAPLRPCGASCRLSFGQVRLKTETLRQR